jgi:hypothetical protein
MECMERGRRSRRSIKNRGNGEGGGGGGIYRIISGVGDLLRGKGTKRRGGRWDWN